MKELQVITSKDGSVVGTIVDVEKPTPGESDVLIKVIVTGTNPKDWKYIGDKKARNSGDDIAGIVDAVGSKVLDFKPGDRVAAFHVMLERYGSYAEYAIAPASTTFHIPATTSFEEAATIPLVALTSAIALYQFLGLPPPWRPATTSIPFVVYGGTTSVGLTALKFARLSKLSPIITIAGGSKDIIEKEGLADVIIDYRGNDHIAEDIKAALGGRELYHVYDGFTEPPSAAPLAENLHPDGKITGILQYHEPLANGHKLVMTYVGSAHKHYPGFPEEDVEPNREFAYIFSRYLTKLLADGKFKTHPYEVVPGGLNGIPEALNRLKTGKVKASKLVARIADTEGL
ncbi:Zeta-crystallin [Dactylella cylindrospora]|nr:Zeta-crystallin [Dactylella cylindrospora]